VGVVFSKLVHAARSGQLGPNYNSSLAATMCMSPAFSVMQPNAYYSF